MHVFATSILHAIMYKECNSTSRRFKKGQMLLSILKREHLTLITVKAQVKRSPQDCINELIS